MESKGSKPTTYGDDGDGLYPQIIGGEKLRREFLREYFIRHGTNPKNANMAAILWVREFYVDTEGVDRRI